MCYCVSSALISPVEMNDKLLCGAELEKALLMNGNQPERCGGGLEALLINFGYILAREDIRFREIVLCFKKNGNSSKENSV
jgi:hypothetical protein